MKQWRGKRRRAEGKCTHMRPLFPCALHCHLLTSAICRLKNIIGQHAFMQSSLLQSDKVWCYSNSSR